MLEFAHSGHLVPVAPLEDVFSRSLIACSDWLSWIIPACAKAIALAMSKFGLNAIRVAFLSLDSSLSY